MPPVDIADLRNYASRDWGLPERLARKRRASLDDAVDSIDGD